MSTVVTGYYIPLEDYEEDEDEEDEGDGMVGQQYGLPAVRLPSPCWGCCKGEVDPFSTYGLARNASSVPPINTWASE